MESMNNSNIFFNKDRETMDWWERKADLERKFLEAVRNAYMNSRAYREIYRAHDIDVSGIQCLHDLEKLPVIHINDIADLQKKDPPFGGFNTIQPKTMRRIYINPGFILQPGDWEYKDTTWAEAISGAGLKKEDLIINTFNYHMWPFAAMLDESVKMIGATVIPTGIGNTLMQVKIMQALKVNGIMGTPSFIMALAQRAEAMGLNPKDDLFLKTAFVTAEMLPESLRSRIEDKLKIQVRQAYGTVLLGCIGYECLHKKGLHVPDNILVEVVDPGTGKGVTPGTIGEIVATNFNTLYPMIRLATGDLSMFVKEKCTCGRSGPMLKKILGRIDQATKVKGTFIHPWQTDEVISKYHEVFKYQVVITRENHIDVMTFLIELRKDVPSPDILRAKIEGDIKNMLTIKGMVEIVPRGTIPDFHKKIEDKRVWE